ncbi:SDR family oxidoreductase [Sandaracinus amylolyticus]|uniref:SDR family oxidoreductase n=1 Tax=Sandaracinus amylolyticus TaxID=927083 RepID=UPI001F3A16EC|nr:SDR family oxidoreductase [Sandaracinus amylolyticus]UJR85648.1 Hypothetical protein I5071_77280 [Sandaracinus amylolyticus]
MRVFVTGGTGFVGTGVVRELLAAGHTVRGLARSDAAAETLRAAGASPVRGDLADLGTLRTAATEADAVVHCGFIHDFASFAESVRVDHAAIEALIEGLAQQPAGTSKVLVSTSGVAGLPAGRVTTEHDDVAPSSPRQPAEVLVRGAAQRGVRSVVLRLPPSVHGPGDHGFVPVLIDLARRSGVSAHQGDGSHCWPAVHRDDAAVLYRLAIEQLAAGRVPAGSALHAVGESGIEMRAIAAAIGERLGLGAPVSRGDEHFGWFSRFAALDVRASSAITRELTGWSPIGPGLLEDIRTVYAC